MTERGFVRGKCSSRPCVRRSWRAGAYDRYYGLLTCTSTATFPPPTVQHHKLQGEGGKITVITSLSGPKCRRRDGLCVCVRERFVWSVSVCVASSWFLISINSLCCFWWCLLSASGQYGTSGHSCYMWNQCSFPHPCCASGWRGFFLCGNTPVTKRDNISITKAVELKRVGSWQTAHTGQITSYHY